MNESAPLDCGAGLDGSWPGNSCAQSVWLEYGRQVPSWQSVRRAAPNRRLRRNGLARHNSWGVGNTPVFKQVKGSTAIDGSGRRR